MSKQSKAKRIKSFNDNWLEDDDFKSWLAKVEGDSSKFKCLSCKKTLSLSSSGRGAVVDHKNGDKHKLLETRKKDFFKPPPEQTKKQVKITESTEAIDCNVRATVIWLMKSIESGFSNNANDDIGDVLRSMDPSSKVLQSFKMKSTKSAYVVNHGLAPYFTKKLYEEIDSTDIIVLSFDESLNDVKQECEMVLVLRYWSVSQQLVCTRYLDSAFFGHGRYDDLLNQFNKLTSKIDKSKVYHISMDGPKVNHKFLRALKIDWSKELMHKLIDIGSCNLHIISGAFKTGAEKSGWNIHKTLKGSWQIFHDAPVRREDYTTVTSSTEFPMFFCATRWVENEKPANRLIKIWPNIRQLWDWWCKQKPASKQPSSLSSKSILNVKSALEDPLTTTKLHFFSFLAGKLNPFLVKYQHNKPMIPFLYRDLKLLIINLLKLIVKKEVIDKTVGKKLVEIDLHNEENLLPLKDIEVGFATEHTIKTLLQKDTVTKSSVREFRKGCQTFVRSMIEKIFERSPITSAFLKAAAVFDPANLVSKSSRGPLMKSFKALLTTLVELNIISVSDGDKTLQEFSNFYDEDRLQHVQELKEFNEADDRLDELFFHKIDIGKKMHLSFVIRLVFLVSHGQAACERNFSLKNNQEQLNQETTTIVSRRICKDYMCAKKVKPSEIVIDKKLILSVKTAYSMYKQHMAEKEKRKLEETEEDANEIQRKKKKEEMDQVCRDIHIFNVGLKQAEKSVNEGGEELTKLCQMKRTDKEKLLSINAKISTNLKRKAELSQELEVLGKKKKEVEKELDVLTKKDK